MQPIILTQANKPVVQLDPALLVDSRGVVCANSGAGKSHVLRLIAEQVGNQIPTLIIDPEGEWATIRTHVHAVLVGPGGDVVADPKLAKRLARRLLELNCSAVLDLSDLKLDQKQAFVHDFIGGLLSASKSLWGPRLVILDEAHKFAPESGNCASRQAVIDLMDSGRKRGLGTLLATQRLSKIAKDAIAEANNVMLGRFAQDVDLRRASDILGYAGKSEWDAIRNLEAGEFMALGPAFSHRGVVKFRTSSKLKTEHPKPGARHLAAPPKPSEQVKSLLAKLGDLPQEAAAEANEIPALRKRIRELEGQVGFSQAEIDAQVQAATQVAVAEVEDRYAQFHEGLRVELVELFGKIDAAKALATTMSEGGVLRYLHEADAAIAAGKAAKLCASDVPQSKKSAKAKRAARAERQATTSQPEPLRQQAKPVIQVTQPAPSRHQTREVGVTGISERILIALLQQGQPTSRVRVALLAGTKATSSTFRSGMALLRASDPLLVVDLPNGDLEATAEAAKAYAGCWKPLPTSAELISWWRGKLGGIAQRIFDALVAAEEPMSMEALAEAVDTKPSSSTLRAGLAKLRAAKGLGLITDVARGQVALIEELLE